MAQCEDRVYSSDDSGELLVWDRAAALAGTANIVRRLVLSSEDMSFGVFL